MPSFPATSRTANPPVGTVVFVVYPGVKLLDLAGPLQIFADASTVCGGDAGYETAVVSVDGGLVQSDTPVPITTEKFSAWNRRRIDTLIVVGGDGAHASSTDNRLTESVGRLAAKARRIGSVCTGAFILAACGLLDARRAVTHWESCEKLTQGYPHVQVETDPIFVRDGHVWTSAGVTAGIDLALAMVSDDFGRKHAIALARSCVAYMVRPGGQSQYSSALDRQLRDTSDRFAELNHWISNNLHHDLRIENLAERIHMSARNFSRAYTAASGVTPAKAVELMRVEAAREMLEENESPITKIATRCGFVDDERMRRAFLRTVRVSPSDYRRRFHSSD